MIDYQPLIDRWQTAELAPWANRLPDQIAAGLCHRRYGDLQRWLAALAALPDLDVDTFHLDCPAVTVHGKHALDDTRQRHLRETLMQLHPWRKGPFQLFDTFIDTEWRSDLKWERLQPALPDLAGRRVLDIGCGSGYHCWRMLGAGAAEVIGIEPAPLFVVQFWCLQKYLRQSRIWVVPTRIEDIPPALAAFDVTFSMGVLYHRRSPIDHLLELKETLVPGGRLILETLVIEGSADAVLVPRGRYARMGNVWFLPSCAALEIWLGKAGYRHIERIDVSVTTPAEQRSTPWMRFHSLSDFLDPDDPTRTVEGYPAPRRAIYSARKPD